MSTPETVVAALIESFNTTDKDLFLSLGAPGATSWVSGIAPMAPHAGERAYAKHHFFAMDPTAPQYMATTTTVTDVVVDEGRRKVAVEAVVSGAGVGEQAGRTLRFGVVMLIELDEECKIVKLREFMDHLTALDFFGHLKM